MIQIFHIYQVLISRTYSLPILRWSNHRVSGAIHLPERAHQHSSHHGSGSESRPHHRRWRREPPGNLLRIPAGGHLGSIHGRAHTGIRAGRWHGRSSVLDRREPAVVSVEQVGQRVDDGLIYCCTTASRLTRLAEIRTASGLQATTSLQH
jgi:hypothetical protein